MRWAGSGGDGTSKPRFGVFFLGDGLVCDGLVLSHVLALALACECKGV